MKNLATILFDSRTYNPIIDDLFQNTDAGYQTKIAITEIEACHYDAKIYLMDTLRRYT